MVREVLGMIGRMAATILGTVGFIVLLNFGLSLGRQYAMTMPAIAETANKQTWLHTRQSGIGASEVSAILDFYFPGEARMNSHKTAFDVFLDKIGKGSDIAMTDSIELGIAFEDSIGQTYGERTGKKISHSKHLILRHPEHPRIICSPDFLVVDEPGGVECKFLGLTPEWRDGFVPEQYWVQCQYSLIQPGFEWWDLAAAIAEYPRGHRFEIERILPDRAIQETWIEVVEQFWRDYIENERPPVCDHLPPTSEQVKRLYAVGTDRTIQATSEIEQMIREHIEAKAEQKAAEERVDSLKASITLFMGENSMCHGERVTATWKNTKDVVKVDWEAVARDVYFELKQAAAPLQLKSIENYEQKHTTVVQGARRFLTKENKSNGSR